MFPPFAWGGETEVKSKNEKAESSNIPSFPQMKDGAINQFLHCN